MGIRNFISTKYIGCRRDPVSNLKSGGGASPYPGAKSLYLLDYSTATFSRASEAAYVDPRDGWSFVEDPGNDGTGSFLPANQPRIFSDGAILIEGSRTNQLRISPDLSASTYTVNASSLTQSIGPAGDVGYYLWTPQGASSYVSDGNVIPSFTPATGTVAASWYAKKFADDNKPYAFWYNNDVGNTFVDMEATSSDWSRAALTIEDFRVRFGIFDSGSAETNTIPLHIYGPQIEEATFPSSFIRCFSVDTTRASDSCIIPAANIPQEMKTGAFEFDIWPEFSSAQQIEFAYLIAFSDTSTSYLLIAPGGGTSRLFYRNATALKTGAFFSFDAGDKITVRVIHNVRFDVLINGSLVDTQEIAGDWSQRTANWSIGGGGSAFGVISRPRRIKDA